MREVRAASAATLVLGTIAAIVLLAGCQSPLADASATAARCVLPSGAITARAGHGCLVPVGDEVTSLDCARAAGMDGFVETTAVGTGASTRVALPLRAGPCPLVSTPGRALVQVATRSAMPADVVAVADFTSDFAADSYLSLNLRCGQSCVGVLYRVGEGLVADRDSTGRLTRTIADVPLGLDPTKPVRVVLQVDSNHVRAWIDGQVVGSGMTSVSGTGPVIFAVDDIDESQTASVRLLDLHVFRAA